VAEVFQELGYEGASLSEITERTGVGKGSLCADGVCPK